MKYNIALAIMMINTGLTCSISDANDIEGGGGDDGGDDGGGGFSGGGRCSVELKPISKKKASAKMSIYSSGRSSGMRYNGSMVNDIIPHHSSDVGIAQMFDSVQSLHDHEELRSSENPLHAVEEGG